MSKLFQPTFRSSSVAAPSIAGANVGALGDYVAGIKLRDAKMRQMDIANQRAEEQAEWQRQDRASLEKKQDYLKNFNYNPADDSSLLNRHAKAALVDEVTTRNNAILQDIGVLNASGNHTGKEVSEEGRKRLEALGTKRTDATSKIPMTQESVYDSVFTRALKSTGDPDLAANLAKVTANKYSSKEDIISQEKATVDSRNKALEKRAQGLARVLKYDSKGVGKVQSKTYNKDDLMDYISKADVGSIDESQIEDAVINSLKNNRSPNQIMQALVSLKETATMGDREFEHDSPGEFLAYIDKNTTKTGRNGFRELNPSEKAILKPNYAVTRDFNTIMSDAGRLSLGARTGNTPRSGGTTNGTPSGSSLLGSLVSPRSTPKSKTTKPSTVEVNNSKPIPVDTMTRATPPVKAALAKEDGGRFLDGVIDFGGEAREAVSGGGLRNDTMDRLKLFFYGDQPTVANEADIRMKIATNKPISQEEYNTIYDSLPSNLKKSARRLLIPDV